MQQRADGTWDRSDSTIYIREDFSLDKILALVEKMEKSQNKLGAGFQKYFNQSASGKTDIAFANVFKQYLPYLKSLQGKKSSQLSKDEINNLKTFTLLLDKQFRVLSKTMTSQDKLRDAEFASTMRKFWRDFALAQNDVYTQPYKRNAEILGGALGGFNGKNSNFSEILDLMEEYKSGTKTWSEHVDDLSKAFEKVGVTTNIAPLVGNVPKLLEAYSRIEAYRKYKSSKMPYDAKPFADLSNLMSDSSKIDQISQQENLVSNALKFYKEFDISLFLNGMNIITKDLPAIHGVVRAISDIVNSFKAGSKIGAMFSESTGITDTKDGAMDKALGMAARGVGSAIGGALGGAAGAAIGGVAGTLVSKAITDDLGGPLATITGGIAAIVSTIGMMWKMMKKSSPILQAVEDLFNLAMILFFLPFGNALGTIFLPILETIIEFALLFNEMITPFLEPIAEAISGFISVVLGAILELLEALLPYIVPIMTILGELIAAPIELLTGWVEWIKNNSDEIKSPLDIFKYFFTTDFQNKLKEIVGEKIARVIENGGKIVNFLADIINIIRVISDTAKSILGFFGGKIGDAIEKGKDVVRNIPTPIKETVTFGLLGSLLNPLDWFANGGIFTSPSIIGVGEAGPEAVVPLSEAGGIGATYVININGDVYGVSDLESRIEKVIQRTANKSYYR